MDERVQTIMDKMAKGELSREEAGALAHKLASSLARRDTAGHHYLELLHGPRLYVHQGLVDEWWEPRFPAPAEIVTTARGTKVLLPSETHISIKLEVDGGDRGTSAIDTRDFTAIKYYRRLSPRGRLGVYERAIVSIPRDALPARIAWRRDGRRVSTRVG